MAIPVSLRRVWLNQKARAGELAQSQPAQENPFFRFAESRKSHGTGRELERQSRQKKQERPVVPSALGERLGFWVGILGGRHMECAYHFGLLPAVS
jgi:hypothetical protein